MQYKVIMISPDWQLYHIYKLSKLNLSESIPSEEIRAMTSFHFLEDCLRELSFPNHVLFVWIMEEDLDNCNDYMNRLGYRYYAQFTWAKFSGNADQTAFGSEYLLMYYKGTFLPFTISAKTPLKLVFTGKVNTRKNKPADAYNLIDGLYPCWSKLQIFGWTKRPGWSIFHQNEKLYK